MIFVFDWDVMLRLSETCMLGACFMGASAHEHKQSRGVFQVEFIFFTTVIHDSNAKYGLNMADDWRCILAHKVKYVDLPPIRVTYLTSRSY